MNESYYRFAKKHNHFLLKNFPQVKDLIRQMGERILEKSGLPANAIPVIPRDKKYFLVAGFKIQSKSFNMYKIHIDTEGLLQSPGSIFNLNTRAYSCIVSIKKLPSMKISMAWICIFGRSGIRPTKWTTFTKRTESRSGLRQTGTESSMSPRSCSCSRASCRTARCNPDRSAFSAFFCYLRKLHSGAP